MFKKFRKNALHLMLGLVLVLIYSCERADENEGENTKEETFQVNIINTLHFDGVRGHGITFDGEYLWVADITKIKKISTTSAVTLEEINTTAVSLTGITWNNSKSVFYFTEDIANAENESLRICEINKQGKENIITDAPGIDATGLANDGEYIYNTGFGDELYKIPISNPENFISSAAPDPTQEGATIVGDHLYTIDVFKKKMYKMRKSDLQLLATASLPGNHCLGLTYDGTYFYVTDAQGGSNFEQQLIYQIEIVD